MACLVSTSFSLSLCSPRTLVKEINPRKAALGRLSSQATARRATNFLAHYSSSKGMRSIYQSHHLHLTAASKYFAESVSYRLDVSSCTRTIITGYWVGPDIDDGWGYVDAFVDRSTCVF